MKDILSIRSQPLRALMLCRLFRLAPVKATSVSITVAVIVLGSRHMLRSAGKQA
jgi:hypothetical protein